MNKTARNDILLAVAIALAAVAVFLIRIFPAAPAQSCEVIHAGATEAVLPLDGNGVYVCGSVEIEISDGSARIKKSGCPEQICVKHKPISRSGEAVICAPEGVMIRITGEGPDFVQ